MARLSLLLLALWAVNVLAASQLKRAGVQAAGSPAPSAAPVPTAPSPAGAPLPAGASPQAGTPPPLGDPSSAGTSLPKGTASSTGSPRAPWPARRNYEQKPTPPKKKRDKSGRSTSSSSGERKKTDETESNSLKEKDSSGESSSTENDNRNTKYIPKSTEERHGWRKWHRKCTRCPEEQKKKWRDPTIMWVCGGYQRARRSFKSECMMRLRNCQDGTMFTPIHEGRCSNWTTDDSRPHGEHFLYDYKAPLSGDSTADSSGTSDSQTSSSSQ